MALPSISTEPGSSTALSPSSGSTMPLRMRVRVDGSAIAPDPRAPRPARQQSVERVHTAVISQASGSVPVARMCSSRVNRSLWESLSGGPPTARGLPRGESRCRRSGRWRRRGRRCRRVAEAAGGRQAGSGQHRRLEERGRLVEVEAVEQVGGVGVAPGEGAEVELRLDEPQHRRVVVHLVRHVAVLGERRDDEGRHPQAVAVPRRRRIRGRRPPRAGCRRAGWRPAGPRGRSSRRARRT